MARLIEQSEFHKKYRLDAQTVQKVYSAVPRWARASNGAWVESNSLVSTSFVNDEIRVQFEGLRGFNSASFAVKAVLSGVTYDAALLRGLGVTLELQQRTVATGQKWTLVLGSLPNSVTVDEVQLVATPAASLQARSAIIGDALAVDFTDLQKAGFITEVSGRKLVITGTEALREGNTLTLDPTTTYLPSDAGNAAYDMGGGSLDANSIAQTDEFAITSGEEADISDESTGTIYTPDVSVGEGGLRVQNAISETPADITQIDVTYWFDNGASINHRRFYIWDDDAGSWEQLYTDSTNDAQQQTVNKTTSLTNYVTAGGDIHTAFHFGTGIDVPPDIQHTEVVVTSTEPATAPDPPTSLVADAVSFEQIDLDWDAPADNGGDPITGYKIERESPIGGGWSTLVADTGSTATTYSDTSVDELTEYNYRVSAINSVGTGSPSNEADDTTPGDIFMTADADRVALHFGVEDSFAADPFTAGAKDGTELRFAGESLRQNTSTTQSAEIRDDRQVNDILRTSIGAVGDLNLELSYGTYDEFLRAAFFASAWGAAVAVAAADTGVSVTASSSTFTHSTGWDTNPTVGEWVKISGFDTAANNGYFKVASVTGNTDFTVENGDNLVDEAAGEAVTINQGASVTNGSEFTHFVIQREYSDIANEFAVYRGMTIQQWAINTQVESIITGSFGFMGKKEESKTADIFTGTKTAAPTNPVTTTTENIQGILRGYADTDATQFSFQLGNNLRNKPVMGVLGPKSLGAGKVGITGTLQKYFESKTLMDLYLNFTETSLAGVIEDGDGNAYVVDFPAIKFTSGQRVAGGENSDIIADMGFEVKRHATEDIMARLVRFPAA